MNLKENLASLKNELAELKERIEADDAEAIARGVELKAEIEAKEKEVEAAEQKAALLNSIGESQIFLTCCDKELFSSLEDGKVFIMEKGRLLGEGAVCEAD